LQHLMRQLGFSAKSHFSGTPAFWQRCGSSVQLSGKSSLRSMNAEPLDWHNTETLRPGNSRPVQLIRCTDVVPLPIAVLFWEILFHPPQLLLRDGRDVQGHTVTNLPNCFGIPSSPSR
jgi:hypothetical protein